jgi:hypothetical protein
MSPPKRIIKCSNEIRIKHLDTIAITPNDSSGGEEDDLIYENNRLSEVSPMKIKGSEILSLQF